MGLWAPLSANAMRHGNPLGPYALAVFFTFGALLSCFVWNIYLMRSLWSASRSLSRDSSSAVQRARLGLLGGAIWGVGPVFNLVAGNSIGLAISYAIGQSAPMVAAAVGGLRLEGIRGANQRAKAFLAMMFIFYILAILLIARANTAN